MIICKFPSSLLNRFVDFVAGERLKEFSHGLECP